MPMTGRTLLLHGTPLLQRQQTTRGIRGELTRLKLAPEFIHPTLLVRCSQVTSGVGLMLYFTGQALESPRMSPLNSGSCTGLLVHVPEPAVPRTTIKV